MASSTTLKNVRRAAWGLLGLVAAGWAVYAAFGTDLFNGKGGGIGARLPGSITVGGPFKLTSHEGKTFDSAELKGAPFALFFGFTRCPDVCPTTLLEMTHHLEALGPAAGKLRAVFVSIDPERDTPQLLKDYLSAFDPRIIGLTGTLDEVAAVARSYRAYYEKVPNKSGDKDGYTMNHSAAVYMMDSNGRFIGTFNFQEKQEIQRDKMRRLAAS